MKQLWQNVLVYCDMSSCNIYKLIYANFLVLFWVTIMNELSPTVKSSMLPSVSMLLFLDTTAPT